MTPAVDRPLLDTVIDFDTKSLHGIRCRTCEQKSLSDREFCPLCGSDDVSAIGLRPQGRVVSWTVVRQAPAHLPTPYTLATVDLDDGIRVLGYADDGVDIDDRITVELFPHRTGDDGERLWWYRFRTNEDK